MDRPRVPARGRRIAPEVKAQALEMLRAGGTRNGIARALGISNSSVRDVARAAGLPIGSVSPSLAVASGSHVLDARARRASLMSDSLDRARQVLDRMWQPHVTYSFDGKAGEWQELETPLPDARSLRELAIVFGILTDKALDLDRYDAEGITASRGAVLELVARLADEEAAESA